MRKSGLLIRLGGFIGSPLLVMLALPGRFSIWPLLFICLIPLLYWVCGADNYRQALKRGLLSGLVMYPLQLYWIIPVLMQYGGLPWFFALPSLMLLALYMSLYLAFFCAGFSVLAAAESMWLLLIGAPALWVGLDWLRSLLFSGFPWMDIGYGFWSVPQIIQAADVFGHYGYTFLVVLINCLLFSFFHHRFSRAPRGPVMIAVIIVLLLLGSYCRVRWNEVDARVSAADKPVIGIVQGNVEQGRKWSPSERERTVRNYLNLSRIIVENRSPSLIVWPETALPFYPREHELLEPISRFVRTYGVTLLTGAPWYEIVDWDTRRINYYNSALLMPDSGVFSGSYFKSHLVPYGEYVPFKRFMPFLGPLVEAVGDFTPGRVEKPLETGEIRAGVLICYESIFERIGRAWVKCGANVLVNLTNDAWYGKSSAPHQSWAMTVYRSVETRRSLVRSANTGISGVIDPLGRIMAESGLFVEWAEAFPVPLMTGETLFVRGGFLFAPICAVTALLAWFFAMITVGRRNRSVL